MKEIELTQDDFILLGQVFKMVCRERRAALIRYEIDQAQGEAQAQAGKTRH